MSNTIVINGRLAKDPELKFTASGKAMCRVVVPDQKQRKDDNGNWVEESATTWFSATVFGQDAEAIAETARKGDKVTITGRLVTREWTGKDGEKHSGLEIDYPQVTTLSVARADRSKGGASNNGWGSAPASDPWATTSGAPF